MVSKLKDFVNRLNSLGIPIPMLRDSKTGLASMTATFCWLSFLTAFLGQLGKISHLVGEVDLSQSNYLFALSLGAYLGRKLQVDAVKKTVTDLGKEES